MFRVCRFCVFLWVRIASLTCIEATRRRKVCSVCVSVSCVDGLLIVSLVCLCAVIATVNKMLESANQDLAPLKFRTQYAEWRQAPRRAALVSINVSPGSTSVQGPRGPQQGFALNGTNVCCLGLCLLPHTISVYYIEIKAF